MASTTPTQEENISVGYKNLANGHNIVALEDTLVGRLIKVKIPIYNDVDAVKIDGLYVRPRIIIFETTV